MTTTRYTGQLDNIDPFALGAQLFHEGKSVDTHDPTAPYSLEGEHADFLMTFYDNVDKGWYRAKREHGLAEFTRQLPAFQAAIPAVGQHAFVSWPAAPDVYYACIIEYVPPERDKVLVRMLDGNTEYPGQSPLRLIDYGYPGAFPTFSLTPPDTPGANAHD